MTAMMVDNFVPDGAGSGIKAALANASGSGFKIAERIRAAIAKALKKPNITLAELKNLTKKGDLDEKTQAVIDKAIHSVVDEQFDEQKQVVTSRLVKFTTAQLRNVQ